MGIQIHEVGIDSDTPSIDAWVRGIDNVRDEGGPIKFESGPE
jgi:hypothetical protein